MRADQLLVERGLASSRAQAQRLIASGVRWRRAPGAALPWHAVAKNGDELPDAAEIELLDTAEARYVSRGGLKLEGALRESGVSVGGRHCLDVGQSTGGFTDCLLQHGATAVIGVDVGHGQLHPHLRADPRVRCVEGLNARALSAADLADAQGGEAAGRFDLIVADLSFISLTLVLPAVVPLLAPRGDLLVLVKPQFELQPGQVGKGGIVRDPAFYDVVEQRLRQSCASLGLHLQRWFDSVVTGGDGNREFFLHATHGEANP
jgi:23S rRNA (cytidine1920-2'-O)/16S rRNA (cytidine1409-2'-O)-methyltransferase